MREGETRTKLEVIEAILARIEAGESERSACAAEGMNRSTFRQMALRETAGNQYARALEGLATDQAEKIDALIDDMRNGTLDPAIGRIELDARKWLACKFLPKQYGDRTDITSKNEKIHAGLSEADKVFLLSLGEKKTNESGEAQEGS